MFQFVFSYPVSPLINLPIEITFINTKDLTVQFLDYSNKIKFSYDLWV